jgi:hypothetical protein
MSLDPSRSTPFGFWRVSRDYVHAARAVKTVHGERKLFPLLYLHGLAIELALKAFLLKRGHSLRELKNMSHGLDGLLSLARRRKLGREVTLSRSQLGAIRALNVTYSSGALRYLATGNIVIPQVTLLSTAAEAIVSGLEHYCTGHRGHA